MGTIFSAYDIRGRAGETLTTEYVWTVGKAFSDWLPEEGGVVVTRSAGANSTTVHALVEGLLLQGRNVIDSGEGDLPSIVNVIADKAAAGGILVTHDETQNIEIITLFDARGVAITLELGLAAIEELITAGNFVPAVSKGTVATLS